MQKEEIKFEDSTILEGMTSLRALFAAKKSGINDRPILRVLHDEARSAKIQKELAYLRAMSREYGFELSGTSADELSKITVGPIILS